MKRRVAAALVAALGSLAAIEISAGSRDAASWTAHLASEYSTHPDLTYQTASGVELKLDVYSPRGITSPNAVVVYFHGGGWEGGNRATLGLMPWLEMGFTAVSATYRGSRVALAPAAVEDTRCVLHWVVRNAARYNFDVGRIVLTGDSAGSHLALMSGMLTSEAGFDRACASAPEPTPDGRAGGPRAAAVVNWYGASDVAELLEGPHARGFAIRWFGSQSGRAELAARLSPLSHVREGGPPVFTVHGDADGVVPHSQAVRLHEALDRSGVPNELVIVPGRGHGGYSREENERAWAAIRRFLHERGVLPSAWRTTE